jgi:hypothetical protein
MPRIRRHCDAKPDQSVDFCQGGFWLKGLSVRIVRDAHPPKSRAKRPENGADLHKAAATQALSRLTQTWPKRDRGKPKYVFRQIGVAAYSASRSYWITPVIQYDREAP